MHGEVGVVILRAEHSFSSENLQLMLKLFTRYSHSSMYDIETDAQTPDGPTGFDSFGNRPSKEVLLMSGPYFTKLSSLAGRSASTEEKINAAVRELRKRGVKSDS